jgi:deoxyribodipyrimidine photo-lyase
MNPWHPSRSAALERLERFAPRAGGTYARARNSDLGPGQRDNVSCLSPWLRYRLITEREVLARVLADHSPTAADKFVQEVFWRTYWKGWLEQRPSVWRDFLAERDVECERVNGDADLATRLRQAMTGRTGIEGFDDWAAELVETGYLHNHARMWFASIWIFTLRLPWVLGADFFLRHLLDADPASNTLSWRWVAGLQTQGKTYLARADNIEKYTSGRFRPAGLATRAEALPGSPPPPARPLPPALAETEARLGGRVLLLHPEDLHPESLIERCGRPALVVLAMPRAFGPQWPWGEKALAFLNGAVADLDDRLGSMLQAPVARLDRLDADLLSGLARQAGADAIMTPCLPTGPAADQLARLAGPLGRDRIALQSIRRDWDEAAWPRARRGFFPFRKHIPELLARAGLQ